MRALLFAAITSFSLSAAASSALAGDVKIALAGDSTVQNYKPEEALRGWGQVIGELFQDDVKIKNFAVGGRSTKTFISEGRWEKLLASKPNYILLQFGHNDSHAKDRPESTDAASDYKEYLRKYADDAKSAGAQIIFITSMHRRLFDKQGVPTEELLPYVDAMKEVAKEKGVLCVDLHASSGELLKKLGEEGAVDLYCSAKDRSHFSEKGAKAMAELIAAGLKGSNADLAKRLK